MIESQRDIAIDYARQALEDLVVCIEAGTWKTWGFDPAYTFVYSGTEQQVRSRAVAEALITGYDVLVWDSPLSGSQLIGEVRHEGVWLQSSPLRPEGGPDAPAGESPARLRPSTPPGMCACKNDPCPKCGSRTP